MQCTGTAAWRAFDGGVAARRERAIQCACERGGWTIRTRNIGALALDASQVRHAFDRRAFCRLSRAGLREGGLGPVPGSRDERTTG